MRRVLLLAFILLVHLPSFAQFGGVSTNTNKEQIGYAALEAQYGQNVFRYTFSVNNGLVTWKFSSTMGNDTGRFRCNNSISGEIIAAECTGVAYWNFACMWLWNMVERKGKYDSLWYKWATKALECSIENLEKGKTTSPNAYKRVKETYLAIKEAEKGQGKMSLWDALCFYSYDTSEYKLDVEDLYNYNF